MKRTGARQFAMGIRVKQTKEKGQSNSTVKQSEIAECLQTQPKAKFFTLYNLPLSLIQFSKNMTNSPPLPPSFDRLQNIQEK